MTLRNFIINAAVVLLLASLFVAIFVGNAYQEPVIQPCAVQHPSPVSCAGLGHHPKSKENQTP